MAKWGGERAGAGRTPKYSSAAEKQKVYREGLKAEQERIQGIANMAVQTAHHIHIAAELGHPAAKPFYAKNYAGTLDKLLRHWNDVATEARAMDHADHQEMLPSYRKKKK